jgi:hypothetical protein
MKFLFLNFLSLRLASILLDEDICEKSKFLRSDEERKGKELAENWKFIVRLEIFGMSSGVKTPRKSLIDALEKPKIFQRYKLLFSHCSGAIIDKNWILTTAKCIRNAQFAKIFYPRKIDNRLTSDKFFLTSGEFHIVPDYSEKNPKIHDIGMIRIDGGFENSQDVDSICVTDRIPKRREKCFVAGMLFIIFVKKNNFFKRYMIFIIFCKRSLNNLLKHQSNAFSLKIELIIAKHSMRVDFTVKQVEHL